MLYLTKNRLMSRQRNFSYKFGNHYMVSSILQHIDFYLLERSYCDLLYKHHKLLILFVSHKKQNYNYINCIIVLLDYWSKN